MSEPLDSLVRGWKQHFASADACIGWGGASERLELELAPGVWLAGELDAWGRDAQGELFFGEWKTANPREKKTWKQVWRMNPQSLSYGVLAAARWPEMRKFTVRKAFKEQVPTYDHAWYKYSEPELQHWRDRLLTFADEIAVVRQGETNWGRCFRYGTKYACPFFDVACNRLQFEAMSAGWGLGGDPLWSFVGQRAAIQLREPGAIVLSPTTVADWLDCHEMYRRKYVELVTPPANDALVLGREFHDELAQHYAAMVPRIGATMVQL